MVKYLSFHNSSFTLRYFLMEMARPQCDTPLVTLVKLLVSGHCPRTSDCALGSDGKGITPCQEGLLPLYERRRWRGNVQISLFFSGDLWPDFNICWDGAMGQVGCIGYSSPSSFLHECVGCYCTSIGCDWITRKSVDVASKDVISSPFFCQNPKINRPWQLQAFSIGTLWSHKVVAITNNGAPRCNSFAKLVASSFSANSQDLLLLWLGLPKLSFSFLLIANYSRVQCVYTIFCYAWKLKQPLPIPNPSTHFQFQVLVFVWSLWRLILYLCLWICAKLCGWLIQLWIMANLGLMKVANWIFKALFALCIFLFNFFYASELLILMQEGLKNFDPFIMLLATYK